MSDDDTTVVGEPQPAAAGRISTWTHAVRTPFRAFLHTEAGGAALLGMAAIGALLWVNISRANYESFWHTGVALSFGHHALHQDLRGWVNSGLMALFFFVVGLEARRELDLGELRDRARVTLPLVAGAAGMALPVAIFVAINAGGSGQASHGALHGWGVAMSTDTAFALGLLAFVGPRFPDRLRAFLLTVLVVDDIVALVVIATAYTSHVSWAPLGVAVALLVGVLAARAGGVGVGAVYALLGVAMWIAVYESGVDPVVVGLLLGLLTYAHSASRPALDRASEGFRSFREQPTAALARQARRDVEAAISPNERLQQLFHPWSSYVVVPLFALANAGIPISGSFLRHAFTSPITLGIIVAYVVGKPVGIAGASAVLTWATKGRLRPPVGWAAVVGAGSTAGIGFTVSLLIASLAFNGEQLQDAKAGVLSAVVLAALVTWGLFAATELLPMRLRVIALLGRSETIVDLADPVEPDRDHIRGPHDAVVTLLEYGDLECPFCGQAEPVVRELLAGSGADVRYVWRHLPLTDVHPHAQLAAEATEAAALQGKFWEMHDVLLAHQDALLKPDLLRYAAELGLDVDRFADDLRRRAGADRVAGDVDGADLSGVAGTPTFFVNGRRHHGAYDIGSLTAAVDAARERAAVTR